MYFLHLSIARNVFFVLFMTRVQTQYLKVYFFRYKNFLFRFNILLMVPFSNGIIFYYTVTNTILNMQI
jgi:hypothetical protein